MSNESSKNADVRMRGFARRVLVEDALRWVDEHSLRLESERVDLKSARGRVLACEVKSSIDVPTFDRAAMDGYALRGAETDGASDYNPLAFKIVGEAMPGRPFSDEAPPQSAVRIMTGAPLPPTADAVLPAEFASEANGQVDVTTAVSPGKHISRRGEDVRAGSVVFTAGRRLRPQDVGLIASLGTDVIEVVRRPRVRLVITGNELVAPGKPRGPSQVFESNSSMLTGLVERDSGVVEKVQHVEDERDSIRNAMLEPGVDVLLLSGGSSVGREDYAPIILADEGELPIHGIAMRPSSPTGIGRIGKMLVILLPGNPVSCLCAYDFFAGRAIRQLGGRNADWPYAKKEATVARKIVSTVGRVDYCRVALDGDRLEPLALSGASILSSTTRADGFVIVPAESEGYSPGTIVTVYLYDSIN